MRLYMTTKAKIRMRDVRRVNNAARSSHVLMEHFVFVPQRSTLNAHCYAAQTNRSKSSLRYLAVSR